MKILFISTSETSDDRRAWSGTVYQAFQALTRSGFEVDYLCALRDYRSSLTDRVTCSYWIHIPAKLGKQTRMDETFHTLRVYKRTLTNFDYSPYDIIFVPTHIAIVNAIPKSVKAKIVHLVDATVDSLFNYYTEFSNLIFHNYWEARILGKRAFRRSDLIIASSDWCKDNAIRQYGIDPGRISVVEFGANIDLKDIPSVNRQYGSLNALNIYWSGVNWERKGGQIAYDTCLELRRRGIDAQFHMTGMRELPEEITAKPWVHNHGFLNKNNPEEYRQLIDVMSRQHIFLFPSKAECSSIAVCEANAFALPCFVYATGGTANYVRDGFNGYTLPLSATAIDFANKIETARGELSLLSANASQQYKEKLNWLTWGDKVRAAIEVLNV